MPSDSCLRGHPFRCKIQHVARMGGFWFILLYGSSGRNIIFFDALVLTISHFFLLVFIELQDQILNDRLSLMSLNIIRCLLQPLRGMMPFHGHGKRQSMNFKLHFARLRCLAELTLCLLFLFECVFPRTVISCRFLKTQVSSKVVKLRKEAPRTFILSNNNIPSKKYWDLAVNRSLQKISRSDSALTKVITIHALSLVLLDNFL